MSNFFGSGSSGPSPLTVAKAEAEILMDMFNRMTLTCSKKCIVTHNEPDLTVGEMACIDRCSYKYLEAQDKVGKLLADFQEQLKRQEAAGLQSYGPPIPK